MANDKTKENIEKARKIGSMGEYEPVPVKKDNKSNDDSSKNDPRNVSFEKGKITAYIFSAPYGTALPTSWNGNLNPAFVLLGFINEDGIVFSRDSDSTDIKDLNGMVTKSEQTSDKGTMKFTLIEAKREAAAKEFYGQDNVSVDAANRVIKDKTTLFYSRSYVIESILDENKARRRVIPRAKLIERGDESVGVGNLLQYEMTFVLEGDDDGVRQYIYDEKE